MQERGTEVKNRSESYYKSRDGEAPSVTSKSILFGVLVILSGGGLISVALQFVYKSDESRKMLAAAITIGIFGGTFHKMSRKYMPLYVAEFQFRYNNRENADIFGAAIKGC